MPNGPHSRDALNQPGAAGAAGATGAMGGAIMPIVTAQAFLSGGGVPFHALCEGGDLPGNAQWLNTTSVHYVPFMLQRAATLVECGVRIGTAAGGQAVKCAIFDSDNDGLPRNRVLDLGALSGAAAAMSSVARLALLIEAGVRYWCAMLASMAGAGMQAWGITNGAVAAGTSVRRLATNVTSGTIFTWIHQTGATYAGGIPAAAIPANFTGHNAAVPTLFGRFN